MPVSIFGETRNHEVLKPSRLGRLALPGLFLLWVLVMLSACVSKTTHLKAVEEAYARGVAEAEPQTTYDQVKQLEADWDEAYRENAIRDKATIENLKRALAAERRKHPRDSKGRFTRVNGVEVDREGK